MLALLLVLAADAGSSPLVGFQKTAWGMTEAEVRALYPDGKSRDVAGIGQYAVLGTFGGFDADLTFRFVGAKLDTVIVGVKRTQKDGSTPVQVCSALRDALTEKYGSGALSVSVDSWASQSTSLVLSCKVNEVALVFSARGPAPKAKKDDL